MAMRQDMVSGRIGSEVFVSPSELRASAVL